MIIIPCQVTWSSATNWQSTVNLQSCIASKMKFCPWNRRCVTKHVTNNKPSWHIKRRILLRRSIQSTNFVSFHFSPENFSAIFADRKPSTSKTAMKFLCSLLLAVAVVAMLVAGKLFGSHSLFGKSIYHKKYIISEPKFCHASFKLTYFWWVLELLKHDCILLSYKSI